MNKLIKGDLVMTNITDKDVDMYVKAGWKLEKNELVIPSKRKSKKYTFDNDGLKIEYVKDSTGIDIVEE